MVLQKKQKKDFKKNSIKGFEEEKQGMEYDYDAKENGEAVDGNIKRDKVKEDILSVLPMVGDVPEVEGQQVEEERSQEDREKEAEEIKAGVEKVKEEMTEEKKHGEDTLSSVAVVQAARASKNPVVVEVEAVMEDGLDDYYKKMTAEQKKEFKAVGEETALTIAGLLREAKVKVVKIVELIRKWLCLISGVNRYFLVQESKIKTDRLLKMKEEGMFNEEEE